MTKDEKLVPGLKPGNIVEIKAQDDVPAHYFEVHEVFHDDGMVGGMAVDGPYAGAYGQPNFDQISEVVFERIRDTYGGRALWRKKENHMMFSYWVECPEGFQLVLDENRSDPMVLKDVLVRNGWYSAMTGRNDREKMN